MRALVVDNGSLTTHLIARRVEQLGWKAVVVRHDALRVAPTAQDWDAVLLSGTGELVAEGRFDAQLELVRNCTVPLLGICGGLHLIGRAYDVDIVAQSPVVGRAQVIVEPWAPLFKGLPRQVHLFQRHSYRLERVPDGFRRIAASPSCPIEAIAHEARAVFGVQGHVELRSDGRLILRRFLSLAC